MRRVTVCVHLLFGLLLVVTADCASYITEAYIATQITRSRTKRQKHFCKAIGWLVMPGGTLAAVQWYVAAPAMSSRRKSRGQSTETAIGGVCGVFDPAVSAKIQLPDTPASVRVRREDDSLRCFLHKLTVWYAAIPPTPTLLKKWPCGGDNTALLYLVTNLTHVMELQLQQALGTASDAPPAETSEPRVGRHLRPQRARWRPVSVSGDTR
jgi:hypothetical protein